VVLGIVGVESRERASLQVDLGFVSWRFCWNGECRVIGRIVVLMGVLGFGLGIGCRRRIELRRGSGSGWGVRGGRQATKGST